jgi:FAD-linked oxidoreductase
MVTTRYRFRNWARTQQCRPSQYHQPDSEAALSALIRAAAEAKARVRVVGAGHSWSDIVLTDQWLVNLDRYGQMLHVDHSDGAQTVTAQAGMRLRDLNLALAEEGLALSAQGSVAEQSLGGLIATGTHGTGITYPNFSGMVTALRLVTADGEVRALTAADGEVFSAACLGLGCLGIVSTVTLRVEPAFHLEERSWTLSFDDAVAQVDTLVAEHEHLKLWWVPHVDVVQVYAQNRTASPVTRRTLTERWEASPGPRWLFAGLLVLGRIFPALVRPFNRLMASSHFRSYRRVAVSHDIFNIPMPPRHDETEWGIPAVRAGEAMTRLRALIEAEGHRVNFVVEARFVAADDVMLSPAQGRDSCQLGAYIARGAANNPYMEAFQTLALSMDGRPHWGKVVTAGRACLERVMPNIRHFDVIRRRMDPEGRFTNGFASRVFDLPLEPGDFLRLERVSSGVRGESAKKKG